MKGKVVGTSVNKIKENVHGVVQWDIAVERTTLTFLKVATVLLEVTQTIMYALNLQVTILCIRICSPFCLIFSNQYVSNYFVLFSL